MRRHKEEPGRAAPVAVAEDSVTLASGADVRRPLRPTVDLLCAELSGGVERCLAALFVQRLGLRLVECDVRGPAARKLVTGSRTPLHRVFAVHLVIAAVGATECILRTDPRRVDVEGAGAVGEDSRGDGADEGLAGDDDGLERGLSRCP